MTEDMSHEQVEGLLLEGLDSGPPIEIDLAWWMQKSDEWAAKYGADTPLLDEL